MEANFHIADEELMSRVTLGDQKAYGLLVHRHGLKFRALAYRMLGDMALAEDIVQDAFLKLWTRAEAFDAKKAKFTTWFYRIVANRCVDEKRKKKPVALPDGFDAPDGRTAADEELSVQDRNRLLMNALDELSGRQRLSVTLSYLDGMSNLEAAEVMKLNIKAYESLLLRSRAKLKSLLSDQRGELLGVAS